MRELYQRRCFSAARGPFENNAAVLLVRAMDLSAFPAAERSSFFKLLGVEPPAKGVATIQAFPEFMKGRGVELGAEIVAGSPLAANQSCTPTALAMCSCVMSTG